MIQPGQSINPFKQLAVDLHPLFFAITGISLEAVHDLVSIGVLSLTGIYTYFKIKQDFFKPKK